MHIYLNNSDLLKGTVLLSNALFIPSLQNISFHIQVGSEIAEPTIQTRILFRFCKI